MPFRPPSEEKKVSSGIRWNRFSLPALFAIALLTRPVQAQVQVAGTLYVDLRATQPSAGSATWTNLGTLGNFTAVGAPALVTNVVATGVPGVLFDGTASAYQGPNSVADIDAAGDRSIEVWAYNPDLVAEETMISWGHRGTDGRNLGFNFGNNATWGAVTHFGPAFDVSWGTTPPSAATWHHLAYTYSNTVTRMYIDGALANSRTLGGALNTFSNEPINLGCQRNSSNGVRSVFYSGYLNTVRVHGGVLTASQVLSNFNLGLPGGPTNPPPVPAGLIATTDSNQIYLAWNASTGALNYNVKRSTANGGPYTNIASNVTATSYFDTGLTPGVTYYYVVSAVNVSGQSANSSQVSGLAGVPHALSGLLHRWRFSETNGTTLADWIGGADGQVVVLSGNSARTNGGLRLFGGAKDTADYAAFPGGLLQGLSNVTVEAWVTPQSAQNWARLFDFGSGNGITATSFFLSLCRGVSLDVQRLEFLPYTVDTGLPTTPGQQYHYVVTWGATNGTGGGGRMAWYRDAALAGSLDTAATTIANVEDTVLWVGRSQYPDDTADADFTELRLYDRVLTPAEINFNRANGPDKVTVPPPVAMDDFMTLNPGAKALIPVMQNDQGAGLDLNSVTIVTPPSSGIAQAKPGGKVLYTHNGSPGASDQFTYRIQNSIGATSSVATVHLTISSSLRLPNTTMTLPDAPPPLGYQVVDAFPGLTFTQPLALRTPRGVAYSNLLFVVERRGMITYIDVTATNPVKQTFLDISSQVAFDNSAIDGELGLLSMEFHPGFATNGIFFVSFTAPGGSPYYDQLSRFTADPVNLTVNTNTQQMLFRMVDREFNHNGSDLHFGLDGYLYMSMGDEGGQYNVHLNAQRLDLNLYSGILRLDVDKKPGSLEPKPHSGIPTDVSGHAFYSIPPDNPFLGVTNLYGVAVNTNALRGEFYAIGFRHPWRFSIDPFSGEIWVGDVGQDKYEEVDLLRKGGNYGWPYFEGYHLTSTNYAGQPGMFAPPGGYVMDAPLWEYPHTAVPGADPQFSGLDVNGSLVYHGTRIPALTNAYVFGDFDAAGNIWALRRLTNGAVTVERLTGETGLAAFGADPNSGDVLMCNYLQNKIRRLVYTNSTDADFPAKLSDTGIFADLATLAPNPGIVSYEPNVAFWSDYAIKRRWFTIPDLTGTVSFARDTNWTLPTGMRWIKHFDLEMERGNPATKRRIETRILTKTDDGVFGVAYKWNDTQDDATLVPDGGDLFTLTITNAGVPQQQVWEIPSRSSCLTCHTPVGGFALTFNTREMNKDFLMNSVSGNQIASMSAAGYFSAPVTGVHTLPAFATATDTSYSLEYRVRSYLAVNCVQCHQPGGAGIGLWDARPYLTLAQTLLINGTLVSNDGGNPTNKVIVPGDLNHSVMLMRLQNTNGFSRMPPLASHQLDQGAISLLTQWITDLTNHQDFAQWQIARFGSTNNPSAAAGADPDHDAGNNYFEFLTQTDPQNASDIWKLSINAGAGLVNVQYQRVPNLGVAIEVSTDLFTWTPWDVPGNEPVFGASAGLVSLQGPLLSSRQFFRARLIQP